MGYTIMNIYNLFVIEYMRYIRDLVKLKYTYIIIYS